MRDDISNYKPLREPTCLIRLTAWEYENAMAIGAKRTAFNFHRSNAAHYKKELMEDTRTADGAAAICELAVAKHTNRFWHAHSWHSLDNAKYGHLPDVGTNIEVRRHRTGTTIAVRKHQVGKGLVIWGAHAIEPEFRSVELLGWLPYDEAWEGGEPASYDPDKTRLVQIERLRL